MTTVKSLAVIALLFGGTSLAVAQTGPATGSQPPRSSSMKKIARSAQARSVPGDQHWQMPGEARRVGFHSLSVRFTAPLESGVPSPLTSRFGRCKRGLGAL